MKLVSLKKTVLIATLAITPILAKRPKKEKPPKEPRPALTQEQKEIIGEKVGQVMGSLCAIAQNPHNPAAVGASIGSIIQALIAIIIERCARRGISIDDMGTLDIYLDELHKDINKEITEIITRKSL